MHDARPDTDMFTGDITVILMNAPRVLQAPVTKPRSQQYSVGILRACELQSARASRGQASCQKLRSQGAWRRANRCHGLSQIGRRPESVVWSWTAVAHLKEPGLRKKRSQT
jgi:hypothetical protein